jgi:hypothetical protein
MNKMLKYFQCEFDSIQEKEVIVFSKISIKIRSFI